MRRCPKTLNIRREGKRKEEGRNENGKKEFARLLSQNGGEAEAYALGSSSLTIESLARSELYKVTKREISEAIQVGMYYIFSNKVMCRC